MAPDPAAWVPNALATGVQYFAVLEPLVEGELLVAVDLKYGKKLPNELLAEEYEFARFPPEPAPAGPMVVEVVPLDPVAVIRDPTELVPPAPDVPVATPTPPAPTVAV